MENVCKQPPNEERHYAGPKVVETNIRPDSPRPDVRQVDCKRRLKDGDFNSSPPPPPAEPEPMGPPPYNDLGKQAKDVFNKGYHFGLVKLDVKTQSSNGVEFNSGGQSDQETGKVFGSLETKYTVKDYGVTFSEKWNTDNTLGTEVTVQDQLLQGLKLGTSINFAPQTGNKSGQITSAFRNDMVAVNADVDLNDQGPIINGALVVGYQGWLAGVQGAFDAQNNKLSKTNFALGFTTGDFTLHTNVDNSDDGQVFGGSIYQKINPRLESAIQLAWSSSGEDTKFGIGAKYNLDENAAIRAKVNNESLIGLGYQQRLRDGVTLTLSALLDGKNFNQGGHKVGLALELEA